jgi:hypothetical protein
MGQGGKREMKRVRAGERIGLGGLGNRNSIFYKTFYNLETNLNSIQIQILNDSSCKIKSNSTH